MLQGTWRGGGGLRHNSIAVQNLVLYYIISLLCLSVHAVHTVLTGNLDCTEHCSWLLVAHACILAIIIIIP